MFMMRTSLLILILFLAGCSNNVGADIIVDKELTDIQKIKEIPVELKIKDDILNNDKINILEDWVTSDNEKYYIYVSDEEVTGEYIFNDNNRASDIKISKNKIRRYFRDVAYKDDVSKKQYKIKPATTTIEAYDLQLKEFFSTTELVLGASATTSIAGDTYIVENNTTANNNASAVLYCRDKTSYRRIPVTEFTMPSDPGTNTVTDVVLYYGLNTTNTANRIVGAYQILRTDWAYNQATWNIYKTGSNWTTAGAFGAGTDYNSSVLDTQVINGASGDYFGWVLMGTGSTNPLTLDWDDDVDVVIRHTSYTNDLNYIYFNSSNAPTTIPYVEITYEAGGTPTVEHIPEMLMFN